MGVHFVGSTPKGGKKFISVWEEFYFGSGTISFRKEEKMKKAPVRRMLIRGFLRGRARLILSLTD